MKSTALPVIVIAAMLSSSCKQPGRANGLYVDSTVQAELQQIQSIDNHAHPVAVVSLGEEDRDFDALPADAVQDPALPAALQQGSPSLPEAWHALFNYNYTDARPSTWGTLEKEKQNVQKQKGDSYPSWVLNHTNTEIMLANRVRMGRGLPTDRFKWVPFADMFLFPLDNEELKSRDPEHRAFFNNEEKLLNGYLSEAQMNRAPPTFDDYLRFISHLIEEWKSAGAVALKFELAYLRDLRITNPKRESAERVYSIYSQSSQPTAEEYRMLQDFLFRHIAREAGRLDLPIHIHCSTGVGSYFDIGNADPLQLESVFNDPALRKTRFVMLHGGWPFAREAAALIPKPNVYVDISAFMYLTYPAEAAIAIRQYLEAAPEKVLYASDASPFSNQIGWAETAWIGSRNGRLALGLALTNMIRDGEITADRAKQIGRMVMRENARRLYKF